MKCSNMIWSGIFLLLAGCSSDRLITTTDQYGRSLSVLHTEDQIFQGPIVVEIGQFDSLGKFNPYATATGEPLIQSVFRGAAPAALGAALLSPPETNINASGGGGGAGTGSTGIDSGSAGGASTGGGVVNVNSAATSNSRSRGGSATGGQASSGSSTSSATSSPTVTGTVGSSTSSATGGSSGTGGSACQGNCGGGNNGNGNSP